MWQKLAVILSIALCGRLVINHVAKVVTVLGIFRHVYNYVPGTCHLVPGVEQGSEDIELTSSGLAFISSGLVPSGLTLDPSFQSAKGRIFTFDFQHPSRAVTEVSVIRASQKELFMPHGLSSYEDHTGEIRLFVVNHVNGGDRVEVFRFDRKTNSLHHIKTVTDPLLYSLNDVMATGPDSFYASNDKYCTNPHGKMIEAWLALPWSNVVYYNEGEATIVGDGFEYANGIAISPNGQLVYVADSVRQAVVVYRRKENSSLEFSHTIETYSSVDNINVDPRNGDLWIGSGIRLIDLMEFMKNASHPCGSQVLRIQNPEAENPSITEMYSDDGRWLRGSSSACYHNKQLLIGTINHKLMHCTVNVPL